MMYAYHNLKTKPNLQPQLMFSALALYVMAFVICATVAGNLPAKTQSCVNIFDFIGDTKTNACEGVAVF